MYIILKGKVSVAVSMPNRPQIQSVIAVCNDGDCFGELALFDFNRISVDSASVSNKPTMRRRGGTCVAIEESFMLRISHE
jgi:CRP-like cAMP-binding protein